jgi:hypothetical protein
MFTASQWFIRSFDGARFTQGIFEGGFGNSSRIGSFQADSGMGRGGRRIGAGAGVGHLPRQAVRAG